MLRDTTYTESIYQSIAHSMAAAGMLAPFIESVFRAAFRSVRREWSTTIILAGPVASPEYVTVIFPAFN